MTDSKFTGNNIRKTFINFFKDRGHTFVPSSSLVPGDDPTLLFTNAGMVQFKDVFLGTDSREYKRAVNSQKCMRVAGKHNDLEDVGRDDTHHTFFEMLGNWSFGDYYKKEAIQWAWELLTEIWGLPKERLYATVFKDEKGEIPTDQEAADIWIEQPGFEANHLFFLGRKDNFWEMADTGPCGPCSEIHYDLHPEMGPVTKETLDTDRFVELWNLVFIQYNRLDESHLEPLPATHVDTGMGLERITAILQNKSSNYYTDLLFPLIKKTQQITGHSDTEVKQNFTPYRVIADHGRAATFLIADGVVPGNLNRNYVCRMIIRRAYRFGGKIGLKEPFLAEIAKVVIDLYGDAYPELLRNKDAILKTLTREEEQFQKTLDKATTQLDTIIYDLKANKKNTISGEIAADLYTTYGMPLEITRDIAAEQNILVDEDGYQKALEKHREASAGGKPQSISPENIEFYREIREQLINMGSLPKDGVAYDPYDLLNFDTNIIAIVKGDRLVTSANPGEEIAIILPETHFYVESGGQVSDTGKIYTDQWIVDIQDMKRPIAGLILHIGKVREGEPKVGDTAIAEVDKHRRKDIMRNHTATHLLHAALHKILGQHARQAGSLVAPDRLRFDFTHPQAVTQDEIEQIEELVNQWIYQDYQLHIEYKPLQTALEEGAMALFGEKYTSTVRTITLGEDEKFSYELCGGTHVNSTVEIGLFLITYEGSAAAGIRRIEAVTGRFAYRLVQNRNKILRDAQQFLDVPENNLTEKIYQLVDDNHRLQKELTRLKKDFTRINVDQWLTQTKQINDITMLSLLIPDSDIETLRYYSDQFRLKNPNRGIAAFGTVLNGKPVVICTITKDLTQEGFHAGELVKYVAKQIGGGGGGKPTLAQAGGKDPSQLEHALNSVPDWIRQKLNEKA